MINTLNIGSFISHRLTNIGVKVYPIIADNDAKSTFIVYRRNGLSSNLCKDGIYQETVSVEITIVSPTYSTSIETATKVRRAIERYRGTYDNYNIDDIFLTFADEQYIQNQYIQKLTFDIIITN